MNARDQWLAWSPRERDAVLAKKLGYQVVYVGTTAYYDTFNEGILHRDYVPFFTDGESYEWLLVVRAMRERGYTVDIRWHSEYIQVRLWRYDWNANTSQTVEQEDQTEAEAVCLAAWLALNEEEPQP